MTEKELMISYKQVGDATWANKDFLEENILRSRSLFTPESLEQLMPMPKQLEVFALLSGLQFENSFTRELLNVQETIDKYLSNSLHYWVNEQNFGLEYCVFKWPNEPLNPSVLNKAIQVLSNIKFKPYSFEIRGIQINPDGTVVARGFDSSGFLISLRDFLKNEIKDLPIKQSGWAHVPLGRILEPVGENLFNELFWLLENDLYNRRFTTLIGDLKIVHEKVWYMEDRNILYNLNELGFEKFVEY